MLFSLVNKVNPFYIANYDIISLLNSPVGCILQRWRCSCLLWAEIIYSFVCTADAYMKYMILIVLYFYAPEPAIIYAP